MSGAIRSDWRPLTMRELVVRYQSHLLDSWDRTMLLQTSLQNLYCLVYNAANSFKERPAKALHPKSFLELHPYRETSRASEGDDSMKLQPENLHVLKGLFAQKSK